SGQVYFMEEHQSLSGAPIARLFQQAGAKLGPVMVPGKTPVVADGKTSPLRGLADFVVGNDDHLVVQGIFEGQGKLSSGVLALGANGLEPVASQGQAMFKMADGTELKGYALDGSFILVPEWSRKELYFVGGIWRPGVEKS